MSHPKYTTDNDPGDENTPKCQYCGTTKDVSVCVGSTELSGVGKGTCVKCIFDRGNAVADGLT